MKKLLPIFAVCATIALVLLTGCPNVSGGGSSGGGGQEEKIHISGTMSLKVSPDLLEVADITVVPFMPRSPDGSRAAGGTTSKPETLTSTQWVKKFNGFSDTVGFQYIIKMKDGITLSKEEYEFVIEKNIQASTTKEGIVPISSTDFSPAKIEKIVEKAGVASSIISLSKWNNCFLVPDSDGKISERAVEDFELKIDGSTPTRKTGDELLRTTTKRVHAIGNIGGITPSFAKSFSRRIGTANSAVDTADFIAIAKGQTITTNSQAKSILKAGLLGKHIVLVEPTAANIADFWAKMNTALTTDFIREVVKDPFIENVVGNPFYNQVKRMKGKTASDFKDLLVYKVHKNGVHIILPETGRNDREYGLLADSIIDSIEEDDDLYPHLNSPLGPANDASLPDIMNAQKVEYTFTHEEYHSQTLKVQFFIWQVYSFDENADYYLVQETVTVQNSQLKCGPTDTYKWHKDVPNGDDDAYGPYMSHVSMDNVLNSASNIYSVAPNTTSGSSTYSEGFSWNLGGTVGLSSTGPSGGVQGGVTFSNSTSRTIPDLSAKYKESTTAPHWDYEIGTEPDWHIDDVIYLTHDIASDTYTNDIILNNNWVWKVDNPSGSYSFDAQVWIMTHWLTLENYYVYVDSHHKNCYDNTTNKNTVSMNIPSRTRENYLMSYEVPSGWDEAKIGRFRDFLTQYFKLWQPNIDIYSVDADGNVQATKDHFTEVVEDFKNNKQTFKDNQFTGTFKFKIKNKTAPDTEYLMTETIDIN